MILALMLEIVQEKGQASCVPRLSVVYISVIFVMRLTHYF